MGLLDRAIKRGINQAVGGAISNALGNVLERKVNEAVAPTVNQAAEAIAPPTTAQEQQQNAQAQASAAQLGGIFGSFAGAAQSYANEAAKSMKICTSCGEPAAADQSFCPSCGSKLPEQTAAQGAVCTGCGRQNDVGTKFCAGCGTKLPAAEAEEAAMQAKNEAALARWNELLPQYPKWEMGGKEIELEEYPAEGSGYPSFALHVGGAGQRGLAMYTQLLKQNGFIAAGEFPSDAQLFKRVNGVVYNFDSEHAFEGGSDRLYLGFCVREPYGGFDYKKPESKPQARGWKDLLGL